MALRKGNAPPGSTDTRSFRSQSKVLAKSDCADDDDDDDDDNGCGDEDSDSDYGCDCDSD